MIQEIVNFIDFLNENSPEVFSENLELKEGLYVFLEKEGDELVIKDENILKVDKNAKEIHFQGNDLELFILFREMYYNSLMLSANKSYLGKPGTFIEIGSPFAIRFNKKSLFSDNQIKTKKDKNKLDENLILYFSSGKEYLENNNNDHIIYFEEFSSFCKNNLFNTVQNDLLIKSFKEDKFIYIFHSKPTINDYKTVYQNYLNHKIFVKANDKGIGASAELNIGNENSKPFIQHKTAPFETNFQLNGVTAQKILSFFNLLNINDIIPNPLPIFVDENESGKLIKIMEKDWKKSYTEIIENLLEENNKQNLQNFYLLFFKYNQKHKKKKIIDIDFVPVFRYNTDDMPKIKAVFKVKSKDKVELLKDFKVENIFDFQSNILNKIFNKQLLQETKNGIWLKYFDDLKISDFATETIVNLFYKYRKSLYDFVYKSKRQAITYEIFNEIMLNSILDDIHRDKEFKRTTDIKEKLNIWFSLYNYFVNSKNNIDMVNKTEQLFERLKLIAKPESSERIRTNDEFAFASGQIIWKLLIQNESANRTHSLLEPFLQKSDANLFKQAIARTYDSYKHKLILYQKKYEFDKIMAEVMGFETEENMKNLLPLILAGYFSETIFKKDDKIEVE
jgi:CRISPR-associated protein Csh1